MTEETKKVCIYCQDTKLCVCVCLGCRTKLEMAKLDLERLKKDQEIRKSLYWKSIRAKNAAARNNIKSQKKG